MFFSHTIMSTTCTTLGTWLHTLDPYAIELWENGPIRWYGLAYIAGFAVGYLLARRVVRTGPTLLPTVRMMDFVTVVMLGVVGGGRLGYAIFYQPSLFWPVSDLFLLYKGGMASHGGMIGMVGASAFYAWRLSRTSQTAQTMLPTNEAEGRIGFASHWLFLMDLVAFVAPIGVFFGRVANFINGELIGRAASADLPWAVKFPQELYDMPPSQLSWTRDQIARIIAMVQSHDAQAIALVEPMLTPRHPSTLYAALSEGVAVFLILLWIYRQPRKPGVIVAWGMIVYAMARIGNEFFREPDAGIGYQALGMTRGQWLTTGVLTAGVVLLIWATQRTSAKYGGWRGKGASA